MVPKPASEEWTSTDGSAREGTSALAIFGYPGDWLAKSSIFPRASLCCGIDQPSSSQTFTPISSGPHQGGNRQDRYPPSQCGSSILTLLSSTTEVTNQPSQVISHRTRQCTVQKTPCCGDNKELQRYSMDLVAKEHGIDSKPTATT